MQSLFSIIHPDNLVKKVMHVSLSFFENDKKLKHNSRKPLQQQKLKKKTKKNLPWNSQTASVRRDVISPSVGLQNFSRAAWSMCAYVPPSQDVTAQSQYWPQKNSKPSQTTAGPRLDSTVFQQCLLHLQP